MPPTRYQPAAQQREAARKKAQDHFAVHDARTELVKSLVAQENAASDAKTIKLRALRLAKEEADRQTAANAPPVAAPARKRGKAKISQS